MWCKAKQRKGSRSADPEFLREHPRVSRITSTGAFPEWGVSVGGRSAQAG